MAFPDGSWTFGNFDVTIAQQLMELDARSSKAQMFLVEGVKPLKMLPPNRNSRSGLVFFSLV